MNNYVRAGVMVLIGISMQARIPLVSGQDGLGPNLYTQNSDGDIFDANTDNLNAPGPMPWFGNPAVRQALNLNDEAFSQLYRNYETNWSNYNQRLHSLGNNLALPQRELQEQKNSGDFQRRFDEGVNGILIDPAERQRFYEIYTQYRGYGAFNDPIIQSKLNLTTEQIEFFNQYDREWSSQLDDWAPVYYRNPRAVAPIIYEMRAEVFDRITATLTPQQDRIWQGLIGEPFDFPADVYFTSPSVSNPTPGQMANGADDDLSDR